MKFRRFFSVILLMLSMTVLAQQKEIEFKVEDNDKTLSIICYNNSDATQEVVLSVLDIKGLKGYKEPIKKQLSPKSSLKFIELTYEYVYSYKLSYSKKKIVTDKEKQDQLAEKATHYLKDLSKINEGIVVFDDVECSRCSYTTSYLMDNNIEFKIVDISNNKKNLDLMWKTIKASGQSMNVKTPVIMVDGEVSHSHPNLKEFLEGLK